MSSTAARPTVELELRNTINTIVRLLIYAYFASVSSADTALFGKVSISIIAFVSNVLYSTYIMSYDLSAIEKYPMRYGGFPHGIGDRCADLSDRKYRLCKTPARVENRHTENEICITPDMNTAQNNPPALGTLNGYTGFHLRIAQTKVFKNFAAQLGELGVSPAIFSALEIVHLNPGITQSTLAKAIHLDHSSMVPLLDKLSSRGLLLRETSTADRRHKMISLTDAGRELHARAAASVAEHERANQSVLTLEERREFFRLLVKFCKMPP